MPATHSAAQPRKQFVQLAVAVLPCLAHAQSMLCEHLSAAALWLHHAEATVWRDPLSMGWAHCGVPEGPAGVQFRYRERSTKEGAMQQLWSACTE